METETTRFTEPQSNGFDFEKKIQDAKKFATDIGRRIPKSAVYWGVGAALVGAAAVGVIMYRNRVRSKNRSTERDLQAARPTEADPDFADVSFGRQPRATVADANLQSTVRH